MFSPYHIPRAAHRAAPMILATAATIFFASIFHDVAARTAATVLLAQEVGGQ